MGSVALGFRLIPVFSGRFLITGRFPGCGGGTGSRVRGSRTDFNVRGLMVLGSLSAFSIFVVE